MNSETISIKALIWELHHNISIMDTLVFLEHGSGIAIQSMFLFSWNDPDALISSSPSLHRDSML